MVTSRKRSKVLIRVRTERILHEMGELSTRDIIFKLEREYKIQVIPPSFHQLLRNHPRIERVKTGNGTNYKLRQ